MLVIAINQNLVIIHTETDSLTILIKYESCWITLVICYTFTQYKIHVSEQNRCYSSSADAEFAHAQISAIEYQILTTRQATGIAYVLSVNGFSIWQKTYSNQFKKYLNIDNRNEDLLI